MAGNLLACLPIKKDDRGPMRANKSVLKIASVMAISLIPNGSWACPACMVGDPKTAGTYLSTTLVMSALPVLLIGGLGYWVWRHHS
jgi:hypothetical protein